ncbi:hypothetical protein AB9F43_32910, partial [Rhizobium leguminosarum]
SHSRRPRRDHRPHRRRGPLFLRAAEKQPSVPSKAVARMPGFVLAAFSESAMVRYMARVMAFFFSFMRRLAPPKPVREQTDTD